MSTTGGLHIHERTTSSSTNLVGGHYYDSNYLTSDPWTTEWTSDADGYASGDLTIDSYYALDENYGHAMVFHLSSDEDSSRAVYGVIGSTEYVGTFDTYQEYDGSNSILGTFTISIDGNGEVLVNYYLEGLDTSTSGGIHIHLGKTCAVADMVQGHFYSSSLSSDPWTTDFGKHFIILCAFCVLWLKYQMSRKNSTKTRYLGGHIWSRRKVFWRQQRLSRKGYLSLSRKRSKTGHNLIRQQKSANHGRPSNLHHLQEKEYYVPEPAEEYEDPECRNTGPEYSSDYAADGPTPPSSSDEEYLEEDKAQIETVEHEPSPEHR